jgi:hypothetical protein
MTEENLLCQCNLPECSINGNVCLVKQSRSANALSSSSSVQNQCFFHVHPRKSLTKYGCTYLLSSQATACQHHLHSQPMNHLLELFSPTQFTELSKSDLVANSNHPDVMVCCNAYMCNNQKYVDAFTKHIHEIFMNKSHKSNQVNVKDRSNFNNSSGNSLRNIHKKTSVSSPPSASYHSHYEFNHHVVDRVMHIAVVVVPILGTIALIAMVICVIRLLRSEPWLYEPEENAKMYFNEHLQKSAQGSKSRKFMTVGYSYRKFCCGLFPCCLTCRANSNFTSNATYDLV